VTKYTKKDLLDLIHLHLGDVDELIEISLDEETCAGACYSCGAVHDDACVTDKEEYCDHCGENAVASVCVLAGVL
jgi:hypothetical protein